MILVRYITYFLCFSLWIPHLSFSASSSSSKTMLAAENKSKISVAEAKSKIQVLGKEGIEFLITEKLDEQAWHAKFAEIYQKYFDQQKIASTILGLAWKNMTQAQREQFLSIQPRRLAKIYYSKFREWKGVKFKVIKAVWVSQKTIVVSSEIIKEEGRSHLVFWYLTTQGQIFDINIDGISMLKTFRDPDIGTIEEKGIEGFLKELSAKINAN